ncbi:hypothetical protein [Cellulomonas sp. 73-145]|uniref:hypothetical protein n=1 Tax=Cellulomonas sp. 73-145 TaxID=1895739 RepID=UPI001ACDDE8A|nr:hypothetical protein [Cellulomonas sp. 73-145]MBN9327979.1 hypothetical protein [Cellulomonas sp.]
MPVQVGGSAAGWTLVDFIELNAVTAAAAGGVATAQFAQLDTSELWLVDHAVVSCTSSTATSVRWYRDSVDPRRLLDGSNSGNFDVADWPQSLQVQPGASLLVQWSGASAGAIGTCTLQARRLRRL